MIDEFLEFLRKCEELKLDYLLVTQLDINTPAEIDGKTYTQALKLIAYLP